MELRSCYFCGVAGRTVETRSVGGTTVALCPGCEDKLARLDRASADRAAVTFGETDRETTAPAPGADTGGTTPAPETPESASGADESPDGTGSASEPTPDDERRPTGLSGLGADERGETSRHRKALRLLGNREFPLKRATAVDLLSGAYDLDREESERLIDLVVDRGLLSETDGELRRR